MYSGAMGKCVYGRCEFVLRAKCALRADPWRVKWVRGDLVVGPKDLWGIRRCQGSLGDDLVVGIKELWVSENVIFYF